MCTGERYIVARLSIRCFIVYAPLYYVRSSLAVRRVCDSERDRVPVRCIYFVLYVLFSRRPRHADRQRYLLLRFIQIGRRLHVISRSGAPVYRNVAVGVCEFWFFFPPRPYTTNTRSVNHNNVSVIQFLRKLSRVSENEDIIIYRADRCSCVIVFRFYDRYFDIVQCS